MVVVLRALTTAAVVAGAAALTQSPQTTTLILTSGDRVTGIVSYYGDGSTTRLPRTFQVQTPDGQRLALPADDVAVIDFAGGRPSAAELDALGADTPHVMTLRNGNSRSGRLVGLVGGQFVRWENQAGVRIDVPIRNINRVYLNQESALAQLETNASGARHPSGWTSWLERGFLARPEVIVDASVAWTDTGLTVERGDRMRFTVAGDIKLSRAPGDTSGPAGRFGLRSTRAPVPEAPVGALIARVGDAGSPFVIGAGAETIEMPSAGRLMLGVNDDAIADNSGNYRVTIIKD